jgi:hypothetical protein
VECREGWCWTLTEDGIVSFGEAQEVVCAGFLRAVGVEAMAVKIAVKD